MARGTHITVVVGNLSADPIAFEGGKGCRFSIPVSEKWGDDENQQHTEWYSVTCFKGQEAHMKYLKKGSVVQVRGRQRTRVADDGTKHVNLVADRVDYISLGPKNEETTDSSSSSAAPF